MWPLLLAGGLGLNWQANKELIPYTTETGKPFSGFWQGMFLGVMLGVWTGVNYGTYIQSGWTMVEKLGWWTLGYGSSTEEEQKSVVPAQEGQANSNPWKFW